MESELLKKIANILATDKAKLKNSFCVERTLQPSDIEIKIDGIGALELPLTTEKIQNLIAVSLKAKFGLRNQTILDENVRSTQEIPVDKLDITFNKNALTQLLHEMRKSLGLEEHVALTPHLHSMLVYGPGQFFKKHQDSEKIDGMVATLVIVLPSSHIGGDLIVEHDKQKHTFSSENVEGTTLKCLAFYADCEHEVRTIMQGYRVALTYNLVITAQNNINKLSSNHELTSYIKDYFADNDDDYDNDPLKLVYFLNHSYTEHGLRWNLLKGADYKNASSFYAAAQELELTPHLALVEIHEIWQSYEDASKAYKKKPSFGELIDEETNLTYWIDAANKKAPFGQCYLREAEICLTKDTDKFEPYDSDYEGYMGNYGNTMDYWYRRAAVVLWKSEHDIPMHFKLNQEDAMRNLVTLTNVPGNEQKIIEIIEKAGKYLSGKSQHQYGSLIYYENDETTPFFSLFAPVAIYIKDKHYAYALLKQFTLHQLINDSFVPHIVALQNLYGVDWCLSLLQDWKEHTRYSSNENGITNIETLIQKLHSAGSNIQLSEYILNHQIETIIKNDKEREKEKPAKRNKSLKQRIDTIRDAIHACILVPTAIFDKLIHHITTHESLYTEIDLANLYFSLNKNVFAQPLNPSIASLHDFLVTTIDQKCKEGIPSPDNWTIKAALPCKCEQCAIAAEFLRSSSEKERIWPLIQERRNHVMYTIEDLELPVDLSVEKKGSPHKLVMVKNDSLHKNAQKKLDALYVYRNKLQSFNMQK